MALNYILSMPCEAKPRSMPGVNCQAVTWSCFKLLVFYSDLEKKPTCGEKRFSNTAVALHSGKTDLARDHFTHPSTLSVCAWLEGTVFDDLTGFTGKRHPGAGTDVLSGRAPRFPARVSWEEGVLRHLGAGSEG